MIQTHQESGSVTAVNQSEAGVAELCGCERDRDKVTLMARSRGVLFDQLCLCAFGFERLCFKTRFLLILRSIVCYLLTNRFSLCKYQNLPKEYLQIKKNAFVNKIFFNY